MYIGGYHGLNYDRPSTDLPDYGVFLQCEWSTTTAGSRGNLVAWDVTDNTAVAGIMRETRGLRVTVHPVVAVAAFSESRAAGVLTTDVVGTTANTRGVLVVVQAYGPHSRLLADTTANGDMTAGDFIRPAADTAGQFNGMETATPTADERQQAVGWSFEVVAAAGAAGTAFKGFVNCLGNI